MNEERKQELFKQINELKEEKNAVVLAHYYQESDIQDIADFVGDSLALAQRAAETEADLIVFAGVHFMAETAKIINPSKKVVLPDMAAGCSLADSCPPDQFREFLKNYPNHTVVTYINASAEIKTMSDWVCTSSNAVELINSIPEDQPIVFAPDVNLGKYLIEKTGRDMVLWEGACMVHEAFDLERIIELKQKYPDAAMIAHPESETPILKIAEFIGSTAALLNYPEGKNHKRYIVATEHGILHKMRLRYPDIEFIPAPGVEDNTCACSECAFMKMNTLEKLYRCMRDEAPFIELDEATIANARRPIDRMLNWNLRPA
ncbi:quinolinate synthase NadA [Phaeocystidibacter marisrubri]|uniref:Quinolinate synthase n=1 Tax=Phaeocystidibacter marisrubri TaxID=1577780 RepID=A0A6L3ZH95_9FLAO|nr:quinolinate synthase NadA [Phaeocystidibacter marisrubri]KAB2816993.1 quinolinate synthase NadA [Phaeocystidibacter marisrubri]GGH77295.1 quinolinate synthase A [Phaeocystidibacter marisrubri]